MTIDNNEQALATMRNVINSFENRFRSVYNYGYKDGYEQGLKDASSELIRKILEDKGEQGEWIWRTDIPIGDGRTSAGYICSNCGKDYWHGNVFNYCPSCGAKMKGGDSE